MRPPGDNSTRVGRAEGDAVEQGNGLHPHRRTGRPEFSREVGNARRSDQRPPAWPEPPEAEAFRILDLHWGRR
jgi:hypothetical protein